MLSCVDNLYSTPFGGEESEDGFGFECGFTFYESTNSVSNCVDFFLGFEIVDVYVNVGAIVCVEDEVKNVATGDNDVRPVFEDKWVEEFLFDAGSNRKHFDIVGCGCGKYVFGLCECMCGFWVWDFLKFLDFLDFFGSFIDGIHDGCEGSIFGMVEGGEEFRK